MKKYLILAAAAIVAMAACAKVEIDDDKTPDVKVTFQAGNYVPQTKASSVFADFPNFKCRGFLHAEGIDVDNTGAIITTGTGKPSYQEFFTASGETISPYNSSDAIIDNPTTATGNVAYWAPSHDYYWPKGTHSYVNFVGWYGTDGTNAVNPTIEYTWNTPTANKWNAKMTWNITGTTAGTAGANYLYSDMAWRYNENPTSQYHLNGLGSSYKGVPMLFHHALSQIIVKAYASGTNLTAGNDVITEGSLCTRVITLENVKITPVILASNLVLTTADPESNTTSQWTSSLTNSAAATDLNINNKIVDQVTKDDAEDVLAATCVIPQELGTSVVLSFDVRILTTYTTGGAQHQELLHKEITLNTDFQTAAWEQNHRYTYYVNILPAQSEVLFDPAIDAAWVETGTTEKEI